MHLAGNDFLASLNHSLGNGVVYYSKLVICLNSSKFYICDSGYEIWIVAHPDSGNLVVIQSSLSLNSVVSLCRNLEFAQKI